MIQSTPSMSKIILHIIEKKIITSLKSKSVQSLDTLAASTKLSIDQTRRGVEWLRHKGLADVSDTKQTLLSLDKNGLKLPNMMLPERLLLNILKDGPQKISSLKDTLGASTFGIAIGIAKKNGWISVNENQKNNTTEISLSAAAPKILPGEAALKTITDSDKPIHSTLVNRADLQVLLKRPHLIKQTTITTKNIKLTKNAKMLDIKGDNDIKGDKTEHPTLNAIDVSATVPNKRFGRVHPLKDVISEIKEIFVSMGFSEISGNMTQSCFWNFDALLTPQDHPSREMQDTFYLDDDLAVDTIKSSQKHTRYISKIHTQTWHQAWNISDAKKSVLRTHTTCITLQHLLNTIPISKKPTDARIFSLGRVFRNEKTSYKHLAEFTQVEGVIHEKGATIRDLMGIQTEFYRRLGLEKVKFWPTFFPYTEPSFQSMVYNEKIGKWVELFGMGIFHPHVTHRLQYPVLAWGGGVERIAMIKYGIDDVREFYANDLQWLRSARRV